ncbi:AI-2E family transporter [Aquimarina agarilytica]|uniref:AI-2E family transporter n=1 Tax=Aquimarina agarilytica TaxID=1087449 RepID=UPI00028A02C9|nr:AI-2E family transporter [Aquimarina agarilytica]
MKANESNTFAISNFSKNIIKATCIIVLILCCLFLILKGFKVILLILAGILVATFFKGIASLIQKKIPLNNKAALGVGVTLFFSVCIVSILVLSSRVSDQIDVLQKELPLATEEAKQKLNNTKLGAFALSEIKKYREKLNKGSGQITIFFSSFFGGLADIYIIVFLGLFFMIQPNMYTNGIIILFPKPKRKRVEEVLLTLGYTLKRWLLGKMFSMLVVGILTGVGLAILGIPLALTLGIFAALITFIPNFGPILSLIPAFLLALTLDGNSALYVVILYGVVQAIESNVITPFIQSKMIAFPLAMILIAQVILGIFTGMLGLILAVPVIAILMVIVKMLYVEDILGDTSVEVVGEELFVDDVEEENNKE